MRSIDRPFCSKVVTRGQGYLYSCESLRITDQHCMKMTCPKPPINRDQFVIAPLASLLPFVQIVLHESSQPERISARTLRTLLPLLNWFRLTMKRGPQVCFNCFFLHNQLKRESTPRKRDPNDPPHIIHASAQYALPSLRRSSTCPVATVWFAPSCRRSACKRFQCSVI